FLKTEGPGVSNWGRMDWVKVYGIGYNISDSVYAIETRYLMKNIGLIYREYDIGLVVLDGCKIDGKIYGFFVDVEEDKKQTANTTLTNYPNPFNGHTIIKYSIPESDFINITIYDILGKEVDVILNDYQDSGTHSIQWVAENLTSGIYFAVIKYKNKLLTHKLLYQK
ncbi:MAG TPA: T9SS type A sorting domain-containing protein, partial [Melioribacteraceae bacterium]|nr:T9SS type A sorting domain-containing protein [Melioribacteraceae bacterium]